MKEVAKELEEPTLELGNPAKLAAGPRQQLGQVHTSCTNNKNTSSGGADYEEECSLCQYLVNIQEISGKARRAIRVPGEDPPSQTIYSDFMQHGQRNAAEDELSSSMGPNTTLWEPETPGSPFDATLASNLSVWDDIMRPIASDLSRDSPLERNLHGKLEERKQRGPNPGRIVLNEPVEELPEQSSTSAGQPDISLGSSSNLEKLSLSSMNCLLNTTRPSSAHSRLCPSVPGTGSELGELQSWSPPDQRAKLTAVRGRRMTMKGLRGFSLEGKPADGNQQLAFRAYRKRGPQQRDSSSSLLSKREQSGKLIVITANNASYTIQGELNHRRQYKWFSR